MRADETVKTLMTALQSGDLELASDLLADDFRLRGLAPREPHKGEFLAVQSELLAGMPDFSYNLSDIRALDDRQVQALIMITGTHTHDLSLPMFGLQVIPRSGLAIVLPQTRVDYELANGHVTRMTMEERAGGGLAGLLQQIGAELPIQPRGGAYQG